MTLFDKSKVLLSDELRIKIGEGLKNFEMPDKDVTLHYFRVQFAEILAQAQELTENGKYMEGQKLLGKFQSKLRESTYKEEQFIKNMLLDIERAKKDIEPQTYEESGKHSMTGNSRAQAQQRSYNHSLNMYSDPGSYQLVLSHQSKKSLGNYACS